MRVALQVESAPGSANYLEVSVEPGHCPCPAFSRRRHCDHLKYATDVLTLGCKRSKYLFKSALHKELRRGDVVAASHWGAWTDRGYGRPVALDYLRKIWSEETLNLDLAVRIHDPSISLAEAIDLFCRSRKVWEFPAVWDDLELAWGQQAAKPGKRPLAGLEKTVDAADYRSLLRIFAKTDGSKDLRGEFRDHLLTLLTESKLLNQAQREVFETRFASGRYEAEDNVLMLLAVGRLPPLATAYHQGVSDPVPLFALDGSHLRQAPNYAYDYHTIVGQERLQRWRDENPDEDLRIGVDTGDVDLRWAGGLMTLFWRFEAFRQVGSTEAMDRLRWCEVDRTERWATLCAWNEDWP